MKEINDTDLYRESVIPTLPNLPVSTPGMNPFAPINPIDSLLPKDFYEQSLQDSPTIVSNEGLPAESLLKNQPEKPGWFEQVGHELTRMNIGIQAGEFAYNSLTDSQAVDNVPEGFKIQPEDIEGFDDKYFPYLYSSVSPNDLKARQQKIREQMEEDERFSNGSLTASLIGGFAGIVSDPTTYLLPMAAGIRRATILQDVFLNMGKVSSNIALDSVARNMLLQANNVGGNFQEGATDAFADFVFGTALVGIGAGAAHGLQASKLWNARKSVNLVADGVTIDPVIDEAGKVTGFAPRSLSGQALNAAQTSAANLYIDEAFHKGGLFSVPYVGEGLLKALGSLPVISSPGLRAAISPYESVKGWYNRLAPVGAITKGEHAGIARADSAWDYFQQYQDVGKQLADYNRGQFFEANGLTGGANTKNALKNFKQTFSNEQTITEEQFGNEVRLAAQDENYKSQWPQVHNVANASIQFFEAMGIDFHAAEGVEGFFLNPRNAWKYLPQNWNIPAMINNPDGWKQLTREKYQSHEFTINQLQKPIRDLELAIEQLRSQPKTTSRTNQIRELEARKAREENLLNNHLIENPDLHILLEDRVLLDESERDQLYNLLSPLREAESNVITHNALLRQYRDEIKQRPKDKGIREKLSKHEAVLEQLEAEVQEIKDELQRKALYGEVPRKFYNRKGDEFEYLNPKKKVKFRPLFESEHHLNEHVDQLYNSILNQTPDDLLQNVFGSLSPGIIEAPQYTSRRSILFDMTDHIKGGFLDPDINRSIASYANVMGKAIGFKKAFPEFSLDKGFEGVLRHFDAEHKEMFDKVNAMTPGKDKTRELNKLRKQREKAIEFMSDTYKAYMGTLERGNPKIEKGVASLRNLVASAKLGGVPVYQIAEIGSIMMKSGIFKTLANGLRPMLKSLNGVLEGAEGEELRANAAHAYIALYSTQNGYARKLYNNNSTGWAPYGGAAEKVGIATENLAHISGNLYGINFIANMNETLAGTLFQSEVMRAAFDHLEGKITLKQKQKMARYGIQIEEWADRFAKGYKDAGGWEKAGGYYSKYYNWADAEASNRMSLSIRRMVQDTVVNSNVFTSPYWVKQPILGMIFMFHGWAYGALNKYAIPMMQRPDAEHLLGALSVIGLSMMVNPIKNIANGKPAYSDDDNLFTEAYKAIDYSGMVGPYAEWFEDINGALGHPIMKSFQAAKYDNRPPGLGALGPVAGYISDLTNSAKHGIKGDITKNDAQRFERLFPFSSSPFMRGILNKYNETLGLPEKRNQAEPYPWFPTHEE